MATLIYYFFGGQIIAVMAPFHSSGTGLTTHSTGGSIEWLSSSKDCSEVEGSSLAPVNSGVGLLCLSYQK